MIGTYGASSSAAGTSIGVANRSSPAAAMVSMVSTYMHGASLRNNA